MKKLKKLLLAITALSIAFVMSFPFVACNPGSEPSVTSTLTGITLDTAGAQTKFEKGEEFSYEGLVVTASYSKSDNTTSTDTVALNDPNLVIDHSTYKKDQIGSYEIDVTYTSGGVTKSNYYTVSVENYTGIGLKVSLASGVSEEILLTESASTASIDLTKIEVGVYTGKGTLIDTLTSDKYTTKLFKDDEELEETDNLKAGVYQIWAYADAQPYTGSSYQIKDWAFVAVVDNPQTLTFDSAAAGTVLKVEKGSNDTKIAAMVNTWKFDVSYASGAKVENVKVDVGTINVSEITDAATVTVSYTENVVSVSKGDIVTKPVTKTVDVTYKVTAPAGPQAETALWIPSATNLSADIAVGAKFVDNELFSGTNSDTTLKLNRKVPQDSGQPPITITNSDLTLTDGSTVNFTYSVRSSGNITENTGAHVISFTAKKDITLKVYSNFANSNVTTPKSGTVVATYAQRAQGETPQPITTAFDGSALNKFGGANGGPLEYAMLAGDTITLSYQQVGASTRLALFAVEAIGPVSGGSETSATYTFDFAELQAKVKERVSKIEPNTNPNNDNKPYITDDTLGDKIQLAATDFASEKNSFITFLSGSTKSDQYRTSSGGCFEIKGDRLQVTLTHAGTITIAFASTGTDNTSDFGLKKADGTFVSGTGATASTTAGMYSVSGTSFVEITFTVEAGTYTITTGSTTYDRGARINKLVVVDGVV